MKVDVEIPDELLDAIADRIAERLAVGAEPSPLMNVEEAAAYLRCESKRIYDLCSQRRIDFMKDGSRTLLRREALDRYLTENEGAS